MEGSSEVKQESPLAESSLHFALDLYQKCVENSDDNVFVSPLSICIALAMTLAGAKENTAEEMKRVLSLEKIGTDSVIHGEFRDVAEHLLQIGRVKIHLANRMYVHSGTTVLEEFKKTLEENYRTTSREVNFEKETEKIRVEINEWVEKETQKKITELIAKGLLTEATRMVLVNAIYFKGDWKEKFDAQITSPQDFVIDETNLITVDMMYKKENFALGKNEELDCQILELPYVGENLSMFIVLPNQMNGLKKLEENITASALNEMISKMTKRKVEVSLPKFKVESQFSLSNVLSAMGMKDLFTDRADLSGITGQRDLFVSAVVHKAFLEVNEEGSEAAAATAAIMMLRCSATFDPIFRADHPFLLFIRDNKTGCILFWGRVVNPPKSNNAKDEL